MSLHYFRSTPWNAGTQLSANDSFVGDGSTTSFTLVNKPGTQLGSTIQSNSIEYLRNNSGFVISNNTFTLSSAPAVNSQIVAPGVNQLVMAAYDTASVPGLTTPTVSQIECFLADPVDISTYEYYGLPGASGIQVSFVNLVTSAGANTSWVQLSSSDPVSGLPVGFGAPGAALYLPGLTAFSPLACAISIGASSCQIFNANLDFQAGCFIVVDPGNNNQEIVQVTGISNSSPVGNGSILTILGNFQFDHSVGSSVFICGWKFWVQLTVPLGASTGLGTNLYNLGLQRIGIRSQRL